MGGSSASEFGCVDGLFCILFSFQRKNTLCSHRRLDTVVRAFYRCPGCALVVESGFVDAVRCSHGLLGVEIDILWDPREVVVID